MALVPVGNLGLMRDTETGMIGTPGGGFGGKAGSMIPLPQQAVKTAPLPAQPADDIQTITVKAKAPPPELPPPDAPPDVTAPGQPYAPTAEAKKSVPAREEPQPTKRQENPEVEGEVLWLRRWKLTIGSGEGAEAIDLSELAFQFQVDQQKFLVPWHAVITVYNVGENILSNMQKEFTHVVLEAGYRGSQYGKVFGGPIAYFRHGRIDATDTFIEIHAIQYDQAMSGALINTWVNTGHTKKDIVLACAAALAPFGVGVGQITELGDEKSPRGRTLYGNPVDVLRDVAHTADAQVWIDHDGKLHLLKPGEALEMANDTVPILNSKTGLVGVPTQTLGEGINVRSLLNPALRPGSQIKVNQKDITQFQVVNEELMTNPEQGLGLQTSKLSIAADGYYEVVSVQHQGENRGNPWYSDIKTMPFDKSKVPVGIQGNI